VWYEVMDGLQTCVVVVVLWSRGLRCMGWCAEYTQGLAIAGRGAGMLAR
jgi:hypothetical protein